MLLARRGGVRLRYSPMSDSEMTTKPTLDTILERINAQGEAMRAGFTSVGERLERIEIRLDRVEGRLDRVESRLDRVEIRLDRVQSMVLDVRADLREFRAALREPS